MGSDKFNWTDGDIEFLDDDVEVVKKDAIGDPHLSADHQAGMIVPKGGSSCANCRFLVGNDECSEPNFIAWDGAMATPPKLKGSGKLPAPATEYCSDWWSGK